MSPLERSLVERARELARTAHAAQEYGGGDFWENHLQKVVALLEKFGETDELLLAVAWLHDTVEDTAVTLEQLRRDFGNDVADLVWRLTNVSGGARRQRQAQTHAKIRQRPGAVRVKLADRIANVEASMEERSYLLNVYRKEYPQFRQNLHRPGEFDEMWTHLDRLLD